MKIPITLLLAFLALAAAVSGQESLTRLVADPKTDTHLEVTALFSAPSPGGFLPVRVTLVNNLKGTRQARVDFESRAGGWGQGANARSTFRFAVAEGKTVTSDILVPLAPPANASYQVPDLRLTVTGSFGDGQGQLEGTTGNDQPAVLLSRGLHTPNGSALDSAASTTWSGARGFAAIFDPNQLPDQWLAFSGYDSMLLLDSEWTAIPAGGRHAILEWVRMGGRLSVYSETHASPASLGLPEETSSGHIEVLPIPDTRLLDSTQTVNRMDAAFTPLQVSLTSDSTGAWPLQAAFGSREFAYGIFMVVLVIFGIVVGPVNLFVFAKSGQRHRLFITTPLISLGTSILLVALILFQDGFGGSGIRLVHMEVRPDGGLNAAHVHQEQFCRTGVLLSKGFDIETPSRFVPLPLPEGRWTRYTNGSGGNYSLQPADGGLVATGDWFQSRSEHGHELAAVIPTRGRIERTDEPGVLLSTFDFPIETLLYVDERDGWHRAEGIKTGEKFRLEPMATLDASSAANKEIQGFATRHRAVLDELHQRRGHFFAVTTAAPGIDTHPDIRWERTRTILTGPVVAP